MSDVRLCKCYVIEWVLGSIPVNYRRYCEEVTILARDHLEMVPDMAVVEYVKRRGHPGRGKWVRVYVEKNWPKEEVELFNKPIEEWDLDVQEST